MLIELLTIVGLNLTWHMINEMRRSLESLTNKIISFYDRPNNYFR